MATAANDEQKGPRPVEIAIAAVLSGILGVVGAAAFLVLQTPETVSELPEPEDRELGRLYVVDGKQGDASDDTWEAKLRDIEEGSSGDVELVEEELNRWAAENLQAEDDDDREKGFLHVEPDTPRFRIADNVLTVSAPLTWSVFGNTRTFDSQKSGSFTRRGDTYVLDQGRLYVGSCPIPGFLGNRLLRDVVAFYNISDELRDGWAALESVAIEDESLKLVIP